MTINSNLLIGYDPKCSLYKREQTFGNVMWYISYYLPNKARVRRPANKSQMKAKQLLAFKEKQLLTGDFDSKDIEKMPELVTKEVEKQRLSIERGLKIYDKITKARKSDKTYYNDSFAIKRVFKLFTAEGIRFFDEINTFEIFALIQRLSDEGLKEATIKNLVTIVKKVFNCFIEDLEFRAERVEFIPFKNPVTKKTVIPKSTGLVRERLLTKAEIDRLMYVAPPRIKPSSSFSPVNEIVRFMIYTGARFGEVIHAEWDDFDLEVGVWNIKIKPNCPTKDRLGWKPKWGKSRTVILFPQAIKILKSMPMVKSFGSVHIRDDEMKITDTEFHPAKFIFPKTTVRKVNGKRLLEHSRVDSIKKAWQGLTERAGVADVQLKDLRTYFNHELRSTFGFSSKEAGAYIGNSEDVNEKHYSPISLDVMRKKLSITHPMMCKTEIEERFQFVN